MRCKPGDLAVCIAAARCPQNIGITTTVIRLATRAELEAKRISTRAREVWVTDRPFLIENGFGWREEVFLAPDAILWPLRPAPEKVERDEEITA